MLVTIFDTGVSNLNSLLRALEKINVEIEVSSDPKLETSALILPGVGSFDPAARKINCAKENILKLIENEVPILGICLGYQVLLEGSEEGTEKGLGIIRGKAVKFTGVKVPHVGWNTIKIVKDDEIFQGISNGSFFYFVHSYYPSLKEDVAIALTNYGVDFPSIAKKGNVYGVQFHPERSGELGLKFLKNFLNLVRC